MIQEQKLLTDYPQIKLESSSRAMAINLPIQAKQAHLPSTRQTTKQNPLNIMQPLPFQSSGLPTGNSLASWMFLSGRPH